MDVVVHGERPGIEKSLRPTIRFLERNKVRVEVHSAEPGLRIGGRGGESPDFVLSVGGDGTILAAARAVAGTSIPVLPINRGGLGFLASAEQRDLRKALNLALEGGCKTEIHRTLRTRLNSASGKASDLGLAVNDAVLRQGDSLRALRAELELDGQSLGTLLADGLIVATAIGSTAYSLSAGGPLLLGGIPALVATPVCPHTLQSRPVVFSGNSELHARVFSRRGGATLSLDGLPGLTLSNGDEVVFSLARQSVQFLRLPTGDSIHPLREKLNWHGTGVERSP